MGLSIYWLFIVDLSKFRMFLLQWEQLLSDIGETLGVSIHVYTVYILWICINTGSYFTFQWEQLLSDVGGTLRLPIYYCGSL